MEHYLYLAIDLFSLIIPLLFSFYPKANFSKKWRYLWPAIAITSVLFIIWDITFTHMDVWGFNERYITGIYIINLPIEEVLFFICIPYSCLFTYEAVSYISKTNFLQPFYKYISALLSGFLVFVGCVNTDKLYTCVTFLFTAFFINLHTWPWKSSYMGRFYYAFLFILIPFFIVNGILTGTGIEEQVVWYNDSENLKIRMGTIPFEDTFYGMLLILMNISIFEWLQKRAGSPPLLSADGKDPALQIR